MLRLFKSAPLSTQDFTSQFNEVKDDHRALSRLLQSQTADFLARNEIQLLLQKEYSSTIRSANDKTFQFARFDVLTNYINPNSRFLLKDVSSGGDVTGNVLHMIIFYYSCHRANCNNHTGYSNASEIGYLESLTKNYELMLVRVLMLSELDKKTELKDADDDDNDMGSALNMAHSYGLDDVVHLLEHWGVKRSWNL